MSRSAAICTTAPVRTMPMPTQSGKLWDEVVVITNGRLDSGSWEQIVYAEFDGQRRKRVLVEIIAE